MQRFHRRVLLCALGVVAASEQVTLHTLRVTLTAAAHFIHHSDSGFNRPLQT